MNLNCVICGRQCLGDCHEARISEGRKPGTRNRWRKIGVVCEGDCSRKLDWMSAEDQTKLAESLKGIK